MFYFYTLVKPSLWHTTTFINSALCQGLRGKQLIILLVYYKIHSFKCQPCTTTSPIPPPALFCPVLKQNFLIVFLVSLMHWCKIKVYLPIKICVVLESRYKGCHLLLPHPRLTLQIFFFYQMFEQNLLYASVTQFKS